MLIIIKSQQQKMTEVQYILSLLIVDSYVNKAVCIVRFISEKNAHLNGVIDRKFNLSSVTNR
jgi:hypothetical protein